MNDQEPIARRASELFERASRLPDPAAANRLRFSRRVALSARPGRMRRFVPLAAAASLLALGLAWWLPRPTTTPVLEGVPASADAAALDSDEDGEIYAWLSDAPVAPDNDQGGAL
jgi:hypothetical protein